ncbi:hypothetical protein FQA39_LY07700 [Lamprigera yunnana]|nr:hypothetical protein FQA39_LY07700 [Lamprigera yunnana]
MKVFLVTLLSVGAFCAPKSPNTRIIGGDTAADGQFPYQAQIRRNGVHHCGGSIINSNTILTAAHCLINQVATSLSVVVGTNQNNAGGVEHQISSITYHTGFTFTVGAHDIGLVKLSSDILYNERVQPIELGAEYIGINVQCTLSGWGYTTYPGSSSRDLQFIDLVTISVQTAEARSRT